MVSGKKKFMFLMMKLKVLIVFLTVLRDVTSGYTSIYSPENWISLSIGEDG